jgi:hypothetical protein
MAEYQCFRCHDTIYQLAGSNWKHYNNQSCKHRVNEEIVEQQAAMLLTNYINGKHISKLKLRCDDCQNIHKLQLPNYTHATHVLPGHLVTLLLDDVIVGTIDLDINNVVAVLEHCLANVCIIFKKPCSSCTKVEEKREVTTIPSSKYPTVYSLVVAMSACYIVNPYVSAGRRFVEIAMKGRYQNDYVVWRTSKFPANAPWSDFLEIGCCLRCGDEWPVTRDCLYCDVCVKAIARPLVPSFTTVSEKEKLRIRGILSWIGKLPLSSANGCVLCSKHGDSYTHGDSPFNDPKKGKVQRHTWWFGFYRSCCTECLETRCIKDGLIP